MGYVITVGLTENKGAFGSKLCLSLSFFFFLSLYLSLSLSLSPSSLIHHSNLISLFSLSPLAFYISFASFSLSFCSSSTPPCCLSSLSLGRSGILLHNELPTDSLPAHFPKLSTHVPRLCSSSPPSSSHHPSLLIQYNSQFFTQTYCALVCILI